MNLAPAELAQGGRPASCRFPRAVEQAGVAGAQAVAQAPVVEQGVAVLHQSRISSSTGPGWPGAGRDRSSRGRCRPAGRESRVRAGPGPSTPRQTRSSSRREARRLPASGVSPATGEVGRADRGGRGWPRRRVAGRPADARRGRRRPGGRPPSPVGRKHPTAAPGFANSLKPRWVACWGPQDIEQLGPQVRRQGQARTRRWAGARRGGGADRRGGGRRSEVRGRTGGVGKARAGGRIGKIGVEPALQHSGEPKPVRLRGSWHWRSAHRPFGEERSGHPMAV